jgi:chromosome segregation ATPase
MHCLTWRDNVEKVLCSVKPTEEKLKEQLLQNIELTSSLQSTVSEVCSLKKSAGDLEDLLYRAKEENTALTRDKEEVQCSADRLSSQLENSREENNKLTAFKEASLV